MKKNIILLREFCLFFFQISSYFDPAKIKHLQNLASMIEITGIVTLNFGWFMHFLISWVPKSRFHKYTTDTVYSVDKTIKHRKKNHIKMGVVEYNDF